MASKRGRKTFGALSLVTSLPGQRPEPVDGLGAAESTHWRRIVASLPPDWFGPSTFVLLAEYCRAIVTTELLASLVPTGTKELAGILKLQNDNRHALMSLATKMRLTQQAKYTEKTAATAAKNAGPAMKPWESAS